MKAALPQEGGHLYTAAMTDPSPSERLAIEEERTERVQEREKSRRFQAVLDGIPLLATLATALVAVVGNLQSQQQYRDTQASERFQNAVVMLSGADLTTRVGGIALLGQVAQTNPERRENVVRLLATYLRVHAPVVEGKRTAEVVLAPAAEEVRAVFAALQYRGDVKALDLGRISARNLSLDGADLTGLVFSRSDLSGSMFSKANLSHVMMRSATLRHTNFSGADLTGAELQDADLTGANLQGADLSGANLQGAQGLTAAALKGATTDARTVLPAGIQVP